MAQGGRGRPITVVLAFQIERKIERKLDDDDLNPPAKVERGRNFFFSSRLAFSLLPPLLLSPTSSSSSDPTLALRAHSMMP